MSANTQDYSNEKEIGRQDHDQEAITPGRLSGAAAAATPGEPGGLPALAALAAEGSGAVGCWPEPREEPRALI
jgi:hypothetical protein